jgi:hypothetical protein
MQFHDVLCCIYKVTLSFSKSTFKLLKIVYTYINHWLEIFFFF